MAVAIPRQGWRKGFHLVATYAPHSGVTPEQRERFWKSLSGTIAKGQAGDRLVVGGDFNAEVQKKRMKMTRE